MLLRTADAYPQTLTVEGLAVEGHCQPLPCLDELTAGFSVGTHVKVLVSIRSFQWQGQYFSVLRARHLTPISDRDALASAAVRGGVVLSSSHLSPRPRASGLGMRESSTTREYEPGEATRIRSRRGNVTTAAGRIDTARIAAGNAGGRTATPGAGKHPNELSVTENRKHPNVAENPDKHYSEAGGGATTRLQGSRHTATSGGGKYPLVGGGRHPAVGRAGVGSRLPTSKQLAFSLRLAQERGKGIPRRVLSDRHACSTCI